MLLKCFVLFLLLAGAKLSIAEFRGARYTVRRAALSKGRAARSAAVQFEVTAEEQFPARALDPVLRVGDVEIREYRYVDLENRTLLFTCSEPDKLQDGASVYLQYETDESTRTDLPVFRLRMLNGEK